MTARPHNPIMTSERRRMREMFAAGMTRRDIAKAVGRCEDSVARHVNAIAPPTGPSKAMRRRLASASRVERFYAACNAALATHPHHPGSPT